MHPQSDFDAHEFFYQKMRFKRSIPPATRSKMVKRFTQHNAGSVPEHAPTRKGLGNQFSYKYNPAVVA